MLFKDSMSIVDESAYESDSSDKDPTTLDEPNEDEVKHDPFEFPHDDKISFSKLLFDLTIWHVQGSNNGDANLNMPLLDIDVQVSDAPPLRYTCSNGPKSRHVHVINEFNGSGPFN
jgi:hypothetical protein